MDSKRMKEAPGKMESGDRKKKITQKGELLRVGRGAAGCRLKRGSIESSLGSEGQGRHDSWKSERKEV